MVRPLEPILPLRVIPIQAVIPHEQVDIQRVQRLTQRLQTESLLRDPLIVTPCEGHYVVLDGATRLMALKKLGCRDIVGQVVHEAEIVGLHTWNHVLLGGTAQPLWDWLEQNTTFVLVKRDKPNLQPHDLAGLSLSAESFFAIQCSSNQPPLMALQQLAAYYMGTQPMQRTSEQDWHTLQEEFPLMTALVIFPEFTIKQVLQAALQGQLFPAGITRFIVSKRILRLNVMMTLLQNSQDVAEKNQQLQQMLVEKFQQGQIRYYEESVYLLDG